MVNKTPSSAAQFCIRQPGSISRHDLKTKTTKAMQTAISWGNYITGVLIVTAGYYLFIGYKFYRQEITGFFSGRVTIGRAGKPSQNLPTKEKDFDKDTDQPEMVAPMQGLYDDLEEVVEDLRTVILENVGNTSKPILLALLAGRLENYAGLRRPAFRVAVNHYIIRQCQESCGIIFTEAELDAAWEELA
jgi:hypothetical protein